MIGQHGKPEDMQRRFRAAARACAPGISPEKAAAQKCFRSLERIAEDARLLIQHYGVVWSVVGRDPLSVLMEEMEMALEQCKAVGARAFEEYLDCLAREPKEE